MWIDEWPEGMSAREFREHPVYRVVHEVAYWGARALPSGAELDAIGLDDATRERLTSACREVADLKETGNGSAFRRCNELALKLLDGLPVEMRSPGYWKKVDPLELSDDPAELAAAIQKRGFR